MSPIAIEPHEVNGLMHKALPQTNLSAALAGARDIQIEHRPVKPVGPDDVLVKVISTGLCGSDSHAWENDNLTRDLILGHESAGVVESVGENVRDRLVGQRVAIKPNYYCMKCEFCLGGHPNLCIELKGCALDPTDGTLSQYFVQPAVLTTPFPESITWEEAGAIQPLAVSIELARRAELKAHQTVAVFGCGPLGLLVMAVAKAYGVTKIIAFDQDPKRIEFARQYAADVAIVSPKNEGGKTVLEFAMDFAKETIAQHGLGMGVDVAVEATGAEACINAAICILKPGGTCVQAGIGKHALSFPVYRLLAKGLNYKGTVAYGSGCFEDAIDLMARQKVDVKPLVTATYPLTQAAEAFKAQYDQKHIKIVIKNQE